MSKPEKLLKHNTTKPIALVVLPFLCLYALVALGMAYHLTFVVLQAYARGIKIDPSEVLMIGAFGTSGGTALGIVGGSMIQTEKQQTGTNIQHADDVQTGGPTITPAVQGSPEPHPESPIAPD